MGKYFKNFGQELKKNHALFVMLLPATIFTIVFMYLPMSGLVLAFKNYRFDLGVFGSEWNGLENFRYLFTSGTGWLINNVIFKKITQSIIFLPYFISWVIVGTFVFALFNYETGILNSIITALGGEKINLYEMPGVWKYIICCFNSWKWCGYNSVIYIAAIMGVDAEIYEAASIDGATIFQRIRFITIPCIRQTLVTMILLQVGRILRGDFEMFYQIVGNNGQLYEATDVIDTFVFRSLLTSANIGMPAAAALYQSLLCFVIIMLVNAVVKRIDEDYALF
ncbi:MAG: ABC transporter permease subunit [Oliverpabstia sp.]